jgi:hypothetical protein
MRSRSLWLLLPLSLVIPAAAVAAGAPFPTPVTPDVPLGPVAIDAPPAERPPVAAPPFEVVHPDVPTHPELPDLPDLPVDVPQGPPDPLPSLDAGIPDLVGTVDLPDQAAGYVLDQAPPFGGEHGRNVAAPVPEPTAGLLIASGLVAIAMRRRVRT